MELCGGERTYCGSARSGEEA
ncbi:hypothetical protein CCACVL1_10679 [Corchorus capsularis]|uniref:Uncharacterized protein n=1 Tax=Corchorus capsularis TaxID=210143 RepID=A0A1R3IQ95_COCAP|nr:hypothetical protein CCACVL1_10679 [Corchorus capsularis]